MNQIVKIDLEKLLKGSQPLILDLGSGTKEQRDKICIDRIDLPSVDIVADLEKGLPFLPDNCVDAIYSNSFLEHIDNLEQLMSEIWRVLKPKGRKYLFVPHFSNPYYYSDYTHQRFFGLYSFSYFSKSQTHFRRKVPNFYHDFSFVTEELVLEFNSLNRIVKGFKRIWSKLINMNPAMQEFYEENLCYVVPCYGIRATLRPEK